MTKLMRVRALLLLIAAVVVILVLLARRAHAQGAPATGSVPAAAAPAQAPGAPAKAFALQGIVVDPAGKPVAQQKLTLHRVAGDGSGAMVDSATSDRLGRFSVRVPAERDTSAVYFVATRWQGQLYIGSPFKPPVSADAGYSVVVGVNPVNMGPAGGGAAGEAGPAPGTPAQAAPPSSDSATAARWFLAVILALVALGAIAYALLAAARERDRERRRELLARIAALDERAERVHGEEATRLERQRAELLAELSSD